MIPKFRVWHASKMYPVHSIRTNEDGSITVNTTDNPDDWKIQVSGKWQVGYLMQSTGLLDKRGREIFEGDIISTEANARLTVGWNTRFASFCLDKKGWMYSHWFGESCDPTNCEVIGNIYQNPGLLETEGNRNEKHKKQQFTWEYVEAFKKMNIPQTYLGKEIDWFIRTRTPFNNTLTDTIRSDLALEAIHGITFTEGGNTNPDQLIRDSAAYIKNRGRFKSVMDIQQKLLDDMPEGGYTDKDQIKKFQDSFKEIETIFKDILTEILTEILDKYLPDTSELLETEGT